MNPNGLTDAQLAECRARHLAVVLDAAKSYQAITGFSEKEAYQHLEIHAPTQTELKATRAASGWNGFVRAKYRGYYDGNRAQVPQTVQVRQNETVKQLSNEWDQMSEDVKGEWKDRAMAMAVEKVVVDSKPSKEAITRKAYALFKIIVTTMQQNDSTLNMNWFFMVVGDEGESYADLSAGSLNIESFWSKAFGTTSSLVARKLSNFVRSEVDVVHTNLNAPIPTTTANRIRYIRVKLKDILRTSMKSDGYNVIRDIAFKWSNWPTENDPDAEDILSNDGQYKLIGWPLCINVKDPSRFDASQTQALCAALHDGMIQLVNVRAEQKRREAALLENQMEE